MAFCFNFLSERSSEKIVGTLTESTTRTSAEEARGDSLDDNKDKASFRWLGNDDVRGILDVIWQDRLEGSTSAIQSVSSQHISELNPSSLMCSRGTHDDVLSTETVISFQFQDTDLVPGVYEGGLKVWECSLDLCKYLSEQHIEIMGHVLELGCGHGLPACWVLKQAVKQRNDMCWVTFSDYNEFVLRDATIKNVVDACSGFQSSSWKEWLQNHVAFGAGDWKKMSSLLLQNQDDCSTIPPAIPKDGRYDFILAAETTYSEIAAIETAELISRHLRPGTGLAYIATKRYYFGVRGGTSCLLDALKKQANHSFDIRTLAVFDNGVGNIRELLLVRIAIQD